MDIEKTVKMIMKEPAPGRQYPRLAERVADQIARWGEHEEPGEYEAGLVGADEGATDSDRLDNITQALWVLAAQVGRIADALEQGKE